jgi:hypothetical protein
MTFAGMLTFPWSGIVDQLECRLTFRRPRFLRSLTIDFPGILGVEEFVRAVVRRTGPCTCTLYEKGFPRVDKDWNFAQQRLAGSLHFVMLGYLLVRWLFLSKPLQRSIAPVFLPLLISLHKPHNTKANDTPPRAPVAELRPSSDPNLHSNPCSPVSYSPSHPLQYPCQHLH